MDGENAVLNGSEFDVDDEYIDLDLLTNYLENSVASQMADFEMIEEDRKMIGNPDHLGKIIEETVMTQINNQIGVFASEKFVENNHGLTFDPRNSAHIQTVENFTNGKIAIHNHISRESLEHNHDRFNNTRHKVFRKKHVNPGMNRTLTRAGTLNKEGITTVPDGYTGRQIPTEQGHDNSAERDHVNASSSIYADPSLQMSCSDENLASTINHEDNLVYTAKNRNRKKSDKNIADLHEKETTQRMHDKKQKSDEMLDKKRKEGEDRLKQEGQKTQKEEIGKMASSTATAVGVQVVMALLKDLLQEIIRQLVSWFKSAHKSIDTFLLSLKEAIKSFVTKLKTEFTKHLKNAASTASTTIVSAIFKPIGNIIKKFGSMIKQGIKSVKDAIDYLRNPANKNLPFSIKIAQIGKIAVAGLTAAGAIIGGEVIEKGLIAIPILGTVLAFQIPLVGSLASIIGLFMGALVAGIIGAMLLNFIDRFIANRLKDEATIQQIAKGNEVLQTSNLLLAAREEKLNDTKTSVNSSITTRHEAALDIIKDSLTTISANEKEIAALEENAQKNVTISNNTNEFEDIFNRLNGL